VQVIVTREKIMDRKPIPQQTIRVFGQAEQQAYERTVAMREVTFTCIVCHQQTTQLRYPGPLPRYCSEECRAVQAQLLNQERVRKQRDKCQAARAARGKASITARSSQLAKPSSPPVLPLLASKLSPPRLPALLLERSQVLARLDNALLHKLTLLQAPAGFGKTTVVNQWLHSLRPEAGDLRLADQHETQVSSLKPQASRVAWVSLDAGDNDLLRFWRYALTACQAFGGQEQRVLRLLAAGWTNREIARELVMSVNTVKGHVKHLYRKLGVSNRVQASEAARQLKVD
jgi:DNA-binding CsgD family transcriptional regulator